MKYFDDKKDASGKSPGERLGELIEEERLTQTAVAEMCGVSPQYVNNIVRRGQRITEDFAARLATQLNVDLNWLFTGSGPMFRPEAGPEAEDASPEAMLRNAAVTLRKAAEALETRPQLQETCCT